MYINEYNQIRFMIDSLNEILKLLKIFNIKLIESLKYKSFI